MMDHNPRHGTDIKFMSDAVKMADLLWDTFGANFSEIPSFYLSTLRHTYSDGKVSMAELFDRVNLPPDSSYGEYREVFDRLLRCDAEEFPDPVSVVSVDADRLFEPPQDFSEDAMDFAEGGDEDMSHKIEMFLKKVLSTVYLDGVSNVSDKEGNPPGPANNYLLSEDGTQFSGIFYDTDPSGKTKEFPFSIKESGGEWKISY